MKEQERDPGRLQCMLQAIDDAEQIVREVTHEDVLTKSLPRYAIVSVIEIVGRSAHKLTSELKAAHPEVPWGKIEGMRRVMVCGESDMTPTQMWNVAREDLPALRPQIEAILRSIEAPAQ